MSDVEGEYRPQIQSGSADIERAMDWEDWFNTHSYVISQSDDKKTMNGVWTTR